MKILLIFLEDLPGTLTTVAEALGKAGVNIDGICQVSLEGKGIVNILLEDVSAARRVLEEIGIQVEGEHDVLVVEGKNQPGEVGRITRKLADAGVNINLVTIGSRNRILLGVDNLEKARTALRYDPLFFKEFIKSGQ